MNQGEAQAQAISYGGRTLCASSIRADDDCVSVPGDISFNIPLQQRLAVEVIHGNVKESLVPLDNFSVSTTRPPRSEELAGHGRFWHKTSERPALAELKARDSRPAPETSHSATRHNGRERNVCVSEGIY